MPNDAYRMRHSVHLIFTSPSHKPQKYLCKNSEWWNLQIKVQVSSITYLLKGCCHFDSMHITQECTALRGAAVVISTPLQCQAVKSSLHLPSLTVAPVQMTWLQARAAEEHALTGTEKGYGWWPLCTRPQS